MIRSIRSSGFERDFTIQTQASSISSNMGKLVTEEIRRKIIALRQTKLEYPAIFQQLNLKNHSTPLTVWNSVVANGSVVPKLQCPRPKNCQNTVKGICREKFKKDRFLSIHILQTEFNGFSSDIRHLLTRHKLIGRAAAKKLMLRTKIRLRQTKRKL